MPPHFKEGDSNLETGRTMETDLVWRVSYRLRAGFLVKDETVLMFDNEIDWVTCLECRTVRCEARGRANDSRCV